MKNKKILSIFISSILLISFKMYSKTLNVGDIAGIIQENRINPLKEPDIHIKRISELIFDKLYRPQKGKTGIRYIPLIAEQSPLRSSVENNVYTIKLKQNIRWLNTQQNVIADDIIYSFNIAKKNPVYKSILEPIRTIEKIDDYNIKIILGRHIDMNIENIASLLIFEIIKPYDINNDTIFDGTGIYKKIPFSTEQGWINGNFFKFEKNNAHQDFKAKNNNLDTIKYFLGDVSKMTGLLLAGRLDLIIDYPRKSLSWFENKTDFKIQEYLPNFFYFIALNNQDPFFSDKKVRQALIYAINRPRIIRDIFQGQDHAKIVSGPILPGSFGHTVDIHPAEYNPVLAKKLLKQAGFIDSNNDNILDKDGMPFEFEIYVPFYAGNTDAIEEIDKIVDQVIADWKAIKIVATPKPVLKDTIENRLLPQKNFQAVFWQVYLPVSNDLYPLFHSSGSFNYINFNDPEIDKLLEQEKQETDIGTIKRIKKTLNYKLSDKQLAPVVYLVAPHKYCVYQDSLNITYYIDHYRFFKYINQWQKN